MKIIYRHTPLYGFLSMCEASELPKYVLDCGAGGSMPPLGMFRDQGYKTVGVEYDQSAIDAASIFEEEHQISLNIIKGDMRCLPFEDESVSFAYSYHSMFHMVKSDIQKSVNEIHRVLLKGGLCYIDMLSIKDGEYGQGERIGEGEFLQDGRRGKVIHSYFEVDEFEYMLTDFSIILKEERLQTMKIDGKTFQMAFIDYILEKT